MSRFSLLTALAALVLLLFASVNSSPPPLLRAAPQQPRLAAVAAAAAGPPPPAAPPLCSPPNPTSCEGVCATLLAKIQAERAKSTWPEYYGDVAAEVFRRGAAEGVFVEVGTAYGGLAQHLLVAHPKLRVIAVDPFYGDYDSGDSMSDYFRGLREQYGQAEASALWARAMAFEAGERFGCRYALHNTFSEKAAPLFPRRSVDMIFIDGDHTRDGVERDIRAWAPVVKTGRMLLFNDYQPDKWPGVVQAVDALAERTAQSVYHLPQLSWGNVGVYNLPELFSTPAD